MSKRRAIYVEGFGHKNPIPAAARVGNIIESGSIRGLDPATGQVVKSPDKIVLYNEEGQTREVGNGPQGGVKPDLAAYAQAVRSAPQNKGKTISDEDLKKAYAAKFGA